jgi:hypothetical protein
MVFLIKKQGATHRSAIEYFGAPHLKKNLIKYIGYNYFAALPHANY